MLTGIKIDNFTAFGQLDIRVGQLRVENTRVSFEKILQLECKDVPWESLGEADILKFDNFKIS